jgi:predicted RNA-binding Zn-ribbon protein involved in translation (DUF1610 family)
MAERYSRPLLRSLRNDLPVGRVLQVLSVPVKVSEGYVRFLCPQCGEFNTATKPETNLGRCFRCQQNFNPIDLVMAVRRMNFADAVEFLLRLTDRADNPRQTPSH